MVSIADEASELADCGLDRLGEDILFNFEIVEVGDEDCVLDDMDDDVVRPVDCDIGEADDEVPTLSPCEFDPIDVGVAGLVDGEVGAAVPGGSLLVFGLWSCGVSPPQPGRLASARQAMAAWLMVFR